MLTPFFRASHEHATDSKDIFSPIIGGTRFAFCNLLNRKQRALTGRLAPELASDPK